MEEKNKKPSDPDLSHTRTSDFKNVYEPAEDSYLLMDALAADMNLISSLSDCPTCVEVGYPFFLNVFLFVSKLKRKSKSFDLDSTVKTLAIFFFFFFF